MHKSKENHLSGFDIKQMVTKHSLAITYQYKRATSGKISVYDWVDHGQHW